MLEKILEIGPALEKENLKPDEFNQKCLEVLSSLDITTDLESFSDSLGKWLLKNPLPRQLNVYNAFGQPPVTVFNNESFVVDIYFWMHADTSLHSHAFNGAFKVLFGKSLHETFKIEMKNEFSQDVALNALIKENSKILSPGDCEIIPRGVSFNHRVVHLSAPTVSLCIRTITDLDTPQWHYFDNGLSILKQETEQSVLKKIFYADYLQSINTKSSDKFLKAFVSTIEISKLLNLFEQLTVDTMDLSDATQELLYNLMMDRFNKEPWFSLYEECADQESSLDYEGDEKDRLIQHLNRHDYSTDEANRLIAQI